MTLHSSLSGSQLHPAFDADTVLINEIRNFPSLEMADDTQPEWWEEADTNATLTEVDLAGEGITEIRSRALKLVVTTASSYGYQRYVYGDEPRLKSGKVVSFACYVWAVGGVAATVEVATSVGSKGTASTSSAAWSRLLIEDVTLDGTYVEIRLKSQVGTAYFVPAGFHLGSKAVNLAGRRVVYREHPTMKLAEDLNGSSGKSMADLDLTPFTSNIAVMATCQIVMAESTSGDEFRYGARMNGSSVSDGERNAKGWVRGAESRFHVNTWDQIMDDNQIIETELVRLAGTGTVGTCRLFILGFYEWE